MFDLTPSLSVPAPLLRLYRILRAVLYGVFVVVVVLLAIDFIFPNEEYFFDFSRYDSPKNRIAAPRLPSGEPLEDARLEPGESMLFNVSASGAFSGVQVSLSPEDGSDYEGLEVSVLRAYRAFLYPEGPLVTYRDGSLLTDGNRFFLVSEGTLRPFASRSALQTVGLSPENFREVPAESLQNMESGDPVVAGALPTGMLFHIENNYYQSRDGVLISFVSDRAFLSQFRAEDAAEMPGSFLEGREVSSEESLGFLPGTLIAYGEAVYAVSTGNILRPIDSPDTFLKKGYQWESIIYATGEEFGIYERGPLYSIKQPHPDGTLFYFADEDQYSLVDGERRRPIPQAVAEAQFKGVVPVVIRDLPPAQSCRLGNDPVLGSFTCTISLAAVQNEVANEYQFTFSSPSGTTLSGMQADFKRYINKQNFRAFVNDLLIKLATRY